MNSREQNRALNSAEYSSQATVLRSMPVRAWLAFTGRCNLNCAHCPRRSYAEGIQVGPDMSEKVFEKVMEKILPFLYDCKVGGNNLGEQLLAKEWNGFRQKLEENEFTRCLVTNGVLLTSERAEKLIKGGWILDISVEGATAETYKKIRNVEFGRFIDMVTECCRIKNSEVKTESRIRLCFTAFYDNIEELPLLVKLAGEMGVDEVMVTHLIPLRESQRNQSLVYHKGLYNKIRADSIAHAESCGVAITAPEPFFINKIDDSNGQHSPVYERTSVVKCSHPWTSVSIDEKGDVMPCCLYDEVMGNLNVSSIEEIWNNPRYRKLRKTVNSPSPRGKCINCPLRGGEFTSDQCAHEASLLNMIGIGTAMSSGRYWRMKTLELVNQTAIGKVLIGKARSAFNKR